MTRNISFLLRRAYERLVASVAALAVTGLMLVSVNAHAATALKPSVSILVPTVEVLVPSVTIELVN
ncbi:MAG TPA: hypothetical protein VFS13_10610 [Steroidobacteraceae bacterium]|jgi:hypothetical protein|nr:hypothetical protein [Steroidobacteraceae bacterium]